LSTGEVEHDDLSLLRQALDRSTTSRIGDTSAPAVKSAGVV
jgi:hypothetical protein